MTSCPARYGRTRPCPEVWRRAIRSSNTNRPVPARWGSGCRNGVQPRYGRVGGVVEPYEESPDTPHPPPVSGRLERHGGRTPHRGTVRARSERHGGTLQPHRDGHVRLRQPGGGHPQPLSSVQGTAHEGGLRLSGGSLRSESFSLSSRMPLRLASSPYRISRSAPAISMISPTVSSNPFLHS